MYSSAQCSVIERVLLPTKDFTNGPETNVRRKKKMPRMNRVKGSNGYHWKGKMAERVKALTRNSRSRVRVPVLRATRSAAQSPKNKTKSEGSQSRQILMKTSCAERG